MSLVTLNEVLPQARAKGCAVGAFNIANYETGKAVVMAAEAEQQPVIIQVYQRLMEDPFIPALGAMMRNLAENASVPVVVHLDHGASLDQVKLAIECGFSSVMFDGSKVAQLDCAFPIEPALEGFEPTVISTASVYTAAETSQR